MFAQIALALALYSAPVKVPACETVGPRLDGTYVTICDGTVVAVDDGRTAHVAPFTHQAR